jgi:putative ABC transport system substrate-binding protein
MTTRRQLLIGALAMMTARHSAAQQRSVRIGVLAGVPREKSALATPIVRALGELGYSEGRGMVLDYRYGTDSRRRVEIARELAAAKCDLIFAFATVDAVRALREADNKTPVVFVASFYDPVKEGVVKSFARPGGNMTGIYLPVSHLAAKRVELAQEILPSARHFLVFTDRETSEQLAETKAALHARGLQLTVVEYSGSSSELAPGFESGRRAGVHAFLPFLSRRFFERRAEMSRLLLQYRLPAISPGALANEPGILAAYHNDLPKQMRRAAEIAARILKGAKPAEIPVEQPDTYELTVNLKTANAIGVKIPSNVLARATRVIE